jgi:drug/metabolite transporter (DMT)-like permease
VRPTLTEALAVSLALVGLWIFTGFGGGTFDIANIYLILSACCYALYTISLSHFSKSGTLISRVFVAFLSIAVISLISILLSEPLATIPSLLPHWNGFQKNMELMKAGN